MNGVNFLGWRGREDKNEGVACPVGGHRPAIGGFTVLWVGALWENRFSFCGKAGCFYLAVGFCLPGWGQNHFFFCPAKEKAVLDSEKEKVDQWKSWGGAVQQDRSPMLI